MSDFKKPLSVDIRYSFLVPFRDALRSLLWIRPGYRLELAGHAYQHSGISLSKAAHPAGLCFEEMKDLLLRRGIKIYLGPDSKEEIESEVEILGSKDDTVRIFFTN